MKYTENVIKLLQSKQSEDHLVAYSILRKKKRIFKIQLFFEWLISLSGIIIGAFMFFQPPFNITWSEIWEGLTYLLLIALNLIYIIRYLINHISSLREGQLKKQCPISEYLIFFKSRKLQKASGGSTIYYDPIYDTRSANYLHSDCLLEIEDVRIYLSPLGFYFMRRKIKKILKKAKRDETTTAVRTYIYDI